ncbi:hypothetical protein ERO13_A04G059726v2 [Gossypium hirsutum]|uniref:Uncharacterized protein n=1 Tax=Gossypium darwinii TaxID=34276 RepID=A0A5D2GXB5_GOSDA|nr:hypothetical protein ERO13_A04G059726v2 [Gossypium hirsutum]TYH21936.1 hypothetical protein ES288_A04G086100v1 [Gossypium darwinii]
MFAYALAFVSSMLSGGLQNQPFVELRIGSVRFYGDTNGGHFKLHLRPNTLTLEARFRLECYRAFGIMGLS